MPECGSLPEAIFNYVLTIEEYVFALSEGKMPENCERARKIVKEPGKLLKSPEHCERAQKIVKEPGKLRKSPEKCAKLFK